MLPLLNLKRQYENIREEANLAAIDVFENCSYIMGENVKSFEKEFSDYLGVKHSVSVGNGTDALIIALKALNIGMGDEVITTPYTFFATAEAISFVGATPVFVDVRLDTFNIDESKIEEKITSKTKAIMPVHIFGQCAEMDTINEIAKKHNLYVIEDACQAAGAEYKGKKAGSLADISCFSFFPTKNLACAGDGGMICTNNDELDTICRALKVHGSGEMGQKAYNYLNDIKEEVGEDNVGDNTIYNPKKYYNYLIGHNSRLDEVQASILRIKLRHLDEYIANRRKTAQFYKENLGKTGLKMPYEDNVGKHSYHLFIVQSEERENVVNKFADKGVATGVYYPVPLHLQKCYNNLEYKEGDMPNAEYLSKRTFAIPMFPEINDEEKNFVVSTIKSL